MLKDGSPEEPISRFASSAEEPVSRFASPRLLEEEEDSSDRTSSSVAGTTSSDDDGPEDFWVLSHTPRGSRQWHPSLSNRWQSQSSSEVPTALKPPPPAPETQTRRKSFSRVRSLSMAALPKQKKKKKRRKKARCLKRIKVKEWKLKTLKHKVTAIDALVMTRYISWNRAYRSGPKLGFWKVSTNIETEDGDPRNWTWCVWNTKTGRMAFGHGEKPEMVLEFQLVKVVD